jgi:hypothetical protein
MRAFTLPIDGGAILSRKASRQKNSTVLISLFSDVFSGISDDSYGIVILLKEPIEMSKRIHIGDEGPTLAGACGPSSHEARRGTGKPVILIHRSAPPPVASGDAATLDDCFEPLGVAAVRVMARFTLPRMQMLPVPTGYEKSRDRLPNSQWEED